MIIDSNSNMVRICSLPSFVMAADSVLQVSYTDSPPTYEDVAEQGPKDSEWDSIVPCGICADG